MEYRLVSFVKPEEERDRDLPLELVSFVKPEEEPAEGGGPDAPSGGSTDAPSGSSTVTSTARTDHRANLSDAELLKQLSGLAFVQGDIRRLRTELISIYTIDSFRRIGCECVLPWVLQQVRAPEPR